MNEEDVELAVFEEDDRVYWYVLPVINLKSMGCFCLLL